MIIDVGTNTPMSDMKVLPASLKDAPPILASGTRAPDKREVSLRWLSGTFMTGITSISLMGVALFVALEGKEQLTSPAIKGTTTAITKVNNEVFGEKTTRLRTAILNDQEPDKMIMDIPTLVKEGEIEVVRRKPFAVVSMPLAKNYSKEHDYPSFNPLDIFSTGRPVANTNTNSGVIYGADIDSDISLRTVDFPLGDTKRSFAASMSLDEVEETVRTNGSILIDTSTQLASLHYVDPLRFGDTETSIFDFSVGQNARIVAENVSVASYTPQTSSETEFFEDVRTIRSPGSLTEILVNAGYNEEQFYGFKNLLIEKTDITQLPAGTSIRIGVEQNENAVKIVRISIYRQNEHITTVAVNDAGRHMSVQAPNYSPALAAILEDQAPVIPVNSDLPTVYDAIYQASYSYGLTTDMIQQIIRLVSANVDFKAKVQPTDRIDAFFSVTDNQSTQDENEIDPSELLFFSAKFNKSELTYYRFEDPNDGSVDYYDKEGRSGRQFLIRNPVPNGKFRSPFGMRRHPVLGYRRMHSGVDWSAPRGTPILAAGDGIVEEAGWHSGGYGRQTKIRHANGYVSSYSHQSKLAKGIQPGARVRQGQIIGFIGATGLATGPHLHYELIVNGTKVDPLRVRLPDGKTLKDDTLLQFQAKVQQINALLNIEDDTTEIASN